ncbi:MAG TPA: serine/threonine-protein kinase, partial [Fimbriiglobus sp.]|nr:serine/threonine-protein kinase [Fimbriiglobus sp.]
MSERDIFIGALQTDDPAGRRTYLEAACGADDALRRRVDALLEVYGRAGSFLEEPAGPRSGTAEYTPSEASTPASGVVIAGRYKLLEVIGEGGMGTVWLADQIEPVRRKVAVKLIKPGMDSRQVLARFEAERQALALMDHPNIAKVHDAGATPEGRPYFAMELVKGVPITRYCDDHHLTLRQRLELFVSVCRAVQHAHQKAVIHRDLKPSNVRVAPYDGRPVVKVIDFGVAKAAGQPLTENTMFTGLGAVVGTPEYMSPEQAELNNADVDTRSDVFSLGVLLYELLTGSTPLTQKRLKEAALLEVLRLVREEEPPRPSIRLSTAEGLPSIAACRGLEPRKLSGVVRGELDWIVMRALEKDRDRRYETANGFAADVQRYLSDEPVQACPPSAVYRFRKFARRNKGPLAAGGLVLLTLVAGIIGTTWSLIVARAHYHHSQQEQRKAQASAAEATTVLEFFENRVLSAARPKGQAHGLGREVSIRAAVDAAEPGIASTFAGQPLAEASIRRVLGLTYWYAGDYAKAIGQHERALDLRQTHLGADHPATLGSMKNLGQAYQSAGRLSDALRLNQEALRLHKVVLGPDHRETLWTMNRLAETLMALGRPADALPLYEEELTIAKATLGPAHADTLIYMDKLAGAYRGLGRLDDAVRLLEETQELYQAKFAPDHPDRLATVGNVALLYSEVGRWAEAIPLLRQSLELKRTVHGGGHPETSIALHNLGCAYRDAGQAAEALPHLEEALRLHAAKPGPDHHNTLIMASNLAWLYRDTGQLEEALALFQDTLRRQQVGLAADHPSRLMVMNHTGTCLVTMKRYGEAGALLRECLGLRTRADPTAWWVSH